MNIYFSGLGGVGIGPLAEIAQDLGYKVQGSDLRDTIVTKELQKRGIACHIGQDGSFLQACHDKDPIDWFVYTAALSNNHPELKLAQKLGIRTAKRDELMTHIIAQKNLRLIAIAGTHGKTTTTGMMIWTLGHLGIPVSYSIGTTISFGPSGKYDPSSQYFVYECDEFDRNFLQFHPYLSLITSIDYDHPDTYPDKKDYLEAFRQFGDQSKSIITWQDQAGDLFAGHPDTLLIDTPLDIKLAGAHNRRNATLVVEAIAKLGFVAEQPSDSGISTIKKALSSFPGTDRRFEKLADNLYTDYAHHPSEIAASIQLARELSDHVVVVYQPHQNIRQHEFKDQYTICFNNAEAVYWLPTYLTREDPSLDILTPEELSSNLDDQSKVHIAKLDEKLWDAVKQARADHQLVLILGAGSIDDWIRGKLNNDE